MFGAGGHNHRHQFGASASDVLPTREAIAMAEAEAQRIASELSGLAEAMRPTIALAVLAGVCPEVAPPRLARCLRLDPVEELARLDRAPACALWPQARIAEAVREIGGGR